MQLSDLEFKYPEELIAVRPQSPFRILCNTRLGDDIQYNNGEIETKELTKEKLLNLIQPGDAVVVNNSKVLKRRLFFDYLGQQLEVLFINRIESESKKERWEVMMPLRKLKGENTFALPEGIEATVVEKNLPQIIEVNGELPDSYFEKNGSLPLPPYIQKRRDKRKPFSEDEQWYQSAWAETPGSLAAPTAGLHFSKEDTDALSKRGINILNITLHVGLGTFLPIKVDELEKHQMHKEFVSIENEIWEQILATKKTGGKIWAVGTTVVRSLESCALGLFEEKDGGLQGDTQLFIRPGFEFKIVDRLMTNFHQPGSTLLALVAAFTSLERVKKAYSWAIEKKFKLFSYGDLTVWIP